MTLAQYLDESGLAVSQLAKHIGVSRQAVYGWLNGQYCPGLKNALRLYQFSNGDIDIRLMLGERHAGI